VIVAGEQVTMEMCWVVRNDAKFCCMEFYLRDWRTMWIEEVLLTPWQHRCGLMSGKKECE
jgi:hypothetical protein